MAQDILARGLALKSRSQYKTMPTAGADTLGKVVQYTGETGVYTNGYFYQVIKVGDDYTWATINVQPTSTGREVAWGDITGNIAHQADLKGLLDQKQGVLNASQLSAVNSGITAEKLTNIFSNISLNAQAIINETNRAEAAEEQINSNLATQISLVNNNISSLNTSLQNEITRAEAAELNLSNNISKKLDKYTSTSDYYGVYAYTKNADTMLAYNSSNVKDTLALRTSTGTLKANNPIEAQDLVTLDYFNNNQKVTSVNGQTGAVTLTKADLGLGAVDNTSDLDKPISNATQAAITTEINRASTAEANLLTNITTVNSSLSTAITNETNRATNAESTLQANIDNKSKVTVSSTGTATDTVSYITIDGIEKKLAGGSGEVVDVKVNGTSVVDEQKIANITIPTYNASNIIYTDDTITKYTVGGLNASTSIKGWSVAQIIKTILGEYEPTEMLYSYYGESPQPLEAISSDWEKSSITEAVKTTGLTFNVLAKYNFGYMGFAYSQSLGEISAIYQNGLPFSSLSSFNHSIVTYENKTYHLYSTIDGAGLDASDTFKLVW